jgi:hypothetical protein
MKTLMMMVILLVGSKLPALSFENSNALGPVIYLESFSQNIDNLKNVHIGMTEGSLDPVPYLSDPTEAKLMALFNNLCHHMDYNLVLRFQPSATNQRLADQIVQYVTRCGLPSSRLVIETFNSEDNLSAEGLLQISLDRAPITTAMEVRY